jgi:hypothetical protein
MYRLDIQMIEAMGATTERAAPFPLPQGHEEVICSLFEGDFHLGLAALINSIVRRGFCGLFWIGCRGVLPPWTAKLKRRDDGLFEVGNALLGFEFLKTDRHFGQYKSAFLSTVFDRGITRRYLWYFDPDITLRCAWAFIQMWVRHGVSLCEDTNFRMMHSRHPLRCAWVELARTAGWGEPRLLSERYFNSGFVGMDVAQRSFLDTWIAAIQLANGSGVTLNQFQKGSREQVFYTVDQDTMNIAVMYADVPFSTMGPDAMGFAPGGFAMLHGVAKPKSWRKKFLRSALNGVPPSPGDKHFIACLDGPIFPYPPGKVRRMKFSAALAALIGRFYRRG